MKGDHKLITPSPFRQLPFSPLSLLYLALAALLLHGVLILPNHPAAMTWGALWLFPLELPVLLAALVLLRPGTFAGRAVQVLVVLVVMTITLAKVADYATFVAYQRAFNLLVDGHLLAAAWNLGSGSVGTVVAGLLVLVGILLVLLVGGLLWWATGRWLQLAPRSGLRRWVWALLLPATALAVLEIGHAMRAWSLPFNPPGAAFTARVGVERVLLYRDTVRDLRDFRVAALDDAFARRPAGELFQRVGQRDVLVIFVESYGRSSFLNPLYRDTHVGTLNRIENELEERGLSMRSAFLTAPMVGGQSWLSHATIASGLWIDNQGRYRALLASQRQTLFHHLGRAGYQTAAVMPAITMAWPEADYFGFDRILAAADLGYAGRPYNWVTMPDQFTLHAMDERLLAGEAGSDRPPVLAQVALISSHAPWLPIPPVIPWENIGDGSVFNTWADTGDSPEVVWRDPHRVREKFRRAVDYSLSVVGAYALRHAENPPLLIILGDHEPAPFVSQVEGFDVPIHIVGPPEVLANLDPWGWESGLVPGDASPVWRMDEFRDRLLEALSSRTETPSPDQSQYRPRLQ